jgi:glycosyltransferase involved in cell wall biosynthesis
MRILIIGKFPPIQGGVSARTFWAAREFGTRGHDVVVLTDAFEVERSHRQLFIDGDETQLQQLSASGVSVRRLEPLVPESHIPHDRSALTRLLGAGLEVCAARSFDLIIGWYLEPYGVAAALLASIGDRPLLLLHAGSDIGRLAHNADCASAYRWALARAVVPTARHLIPRVEALGATRVVPLPPQRRLPPPFFEKQPTLPIGEYTAAAAEYFPTWQTSGAQTSGERGPVVSIYGKVGDVKGTFDLVAALAVLAREGHAFTFIVTASGTRAAIERLIRTVQEEQRLAERTRLLPPLPPWRVPALLQHSDIVCYLERDFPISFHAPVVPREVLASSACLVCSREIAAKQAFAQSLVSGKNYVEVVDPKDIGALAASLRMLFDDPEGRRDIGRRGKHLSESWEAELAVVDPVVITAERVGAGEILA